MSHLLTNIKFYLGAVTLNATKTSTIRNQGGWYTATGVYCMKAQHVIRKHCKFCTELALRWCDYTVIALLPREHSNVSNNIQRQHRHCGVVRLTATSMLCIHLYLQHWYLHWDRQASAATQWQCRTPRDNLASVPRHTTRIHTLPIINSHICSCQWKCGFGVEWSV